MNGKRFTVYILGICLLLSGKAAGQFGKSLSATTAEKNRPQRDLPIPPADWNRFDYRTLDDFRTLFGSKRISPPSDAEGKIDLWCGVEIDNISDVHPETGTYRVRGYCWLYYRDQQYAFESQLAESLSWKYEDLENLIWTPQIEFVNSIEVPDTWLESVDIWCDGSVSRSFGFAVTLSDQQRLLDFTWFPCETLRFAVEINTNYESEYLTMHWCEDTEISHAMSRTLAKGSPAFRFGNPFADVYDKEYRAGGISHYSTLRLTLDAERRKGYYMFHIVLPVVAILAVFASGLMVRLSAFDAKNALCLTCLLSMLAYCIVIAQDLPKLGYLTFGDILIVVAYMLLAIGTIVNTIEKWHNGVKKPSVSFLRRLQTGIAIVSLAFSATYTLVFLFM